MTPGDAGVEDTPVDVNTERFNEEAVDNAKTAARFDVQAEAYYRDYFGSESQIIDAERPEEGVYEGEVQLRHALDYAGVDKVVRTPDGRTVCIAQRIRNCRTNRWKHPFTPADTDFSFRDRPSEIERYRTARDQPGGVVPLYGFGVRGAPRKGEEDTVQRFVLVDTESLVTYIDAGTIVPRGPFDSPKGGAAVYIDLTELKGGVAEDVILESWGKTDAPDTSAEPAGPSDQ